jgi:SAM-dependent methyltransferase
VAFEELKARQSTAWGNGRFEVVSETAGDVHDGVVEALAPAAGERWLDLACGTGAVAERAAGAGASVTGVDFAPGMIETARRRAAERALPIDYRVGDCEALAEVDDSAFDIVSSTFGVIFCPDQEAAGRELARVTRPGGRLGLATWMPDGGIGGLMAMMARFQPPPPPGAGNPLDWGRQERVEELLGDDFELRLEERTSTLSIGSAEEYWRLMVEHFGPLKTLAESFDDGRREELHRSWVDFVDANYRSNGSIEHPREYLLVLGTRK